MSALLSPEDLKRQALANVQDATESNAENPALTALRDSSLAALKAAVFPGRKTEQWKYTSLQPLADGHLNRRAAAAATPADLPKLGDYRLVLVNGRLDESTSALPDGVTLKREASRLEGLTTPFALYNGAALDDAVTLEVAENASLAVDMDEGFQLSQFYTVETKCDPDGHEVLDSAGKRLANVRIACTEVGTSADRMFPTMNISVKIIRKPAYYVYNVTVPMVIFNILAFMQFTIAPQFIPERLSISLTLVLTTAAYKFAVASLVPALSYMTFLDECVPRPHADSAHTGS